MKSARSFHMDCWSRTSLFDKVGGNLTRLQSNFTQLLFVRKAPLCAVTSSSANPVIEVVRKMSAFSMCSPLNLNANETLTVFLTLKV